MKIRLVGSPDLVRAWNAHFGRLLGVSGPEYSSRYGKAEIRVYIDIDDRLAADIVGLQAPSAIPAAPGTAATRRGKRVTSKPRSV